MSQALFPELDLELPDDRPKPSKRASYFAAVALEQSIDKELDYEVPAAMWDEVKVGQRVRVPLGRGNKLAFGYIVGLHRDQRYPKTKPIRTIADPRPLVEGQLLELARWIGRYYVCPIGTVIDSILPSAVKKRVGVGYLTMCRLAMTRDAVQDLLETTKAPKRRALLGRLLQVEEGGEIELTKLASEAGVTPPTVRKLSKLGVIALHNVADLPALSVPRNWSGEKQQPLQLSDEQRVVMDELVPRLGGEFSVNLLHGVTGSGKTEVYLQAIAKVVEAGKQAIVLVPEIALTPQTVRRFTGRFEKVAVLHSGLTAGARHRFWQQIAAGQADVVVGARSAIFAPVPELGIVVVDEEHENSYKQDQAPRYHARDVAIKRAQMAECCVVLGSATPSLESWGRLDVGTLGRGKFTKSGRPNVPTTNAQTNHLLSLPSRVSHRPMPAIEVIDLRNVQRQTKRIELLSPRLEHLLRNMKDKGEQGILLLNRRGYANYVFCPSCLEPVNCRFCDATMTYHRNVGEGGGGGSFEAGKHTGQLHCHYCLAVNPLPPSCEACGHKLSLFGLGTQRVEEEIHRKLPDLRFERVDSDTMRGGAQYEQVLNRFSRGELDVLLGTQMIAKGLDYPNVTFVGIVSGDTALSLPDFRASERTFQLITQVAGRAGRGDKPGRVALQTFMPDDPTIQAALAGNYVEFAERELALRKQVGQPPFARMARIVVRDQDEKKLAARCQQLVVALGPAVASENAVTLRGPHPCAISRISGYWRQQILLSAPSALPLQRVLSRARSAGNFATNDRIAVDVDPVSLL